MKSRGFTLIELLIVVAIIGILAAIAVPNFLNAQTRATIARVQSDFKAMSTALEMYKLDNNSYPNDHDLDAWMNGREHGMFSLTSPIAFMASIPCDPFVMKNVSSWQGQNSNAYSNEGICGYEMGSGADNSGQYRKQAYSILSYGPDLNDDIGPHDGFPFGVRLCPYDGSNGLKSNGDMHYISGDYMSGCLQMNRLDPKDQLVGSGC